MSSFVTTDAIRTAFSAAMSGMYRKEVPLYGALLDIVDAANTDVLDADPTRRAAMERDGEIARLDVERHGAIRVGTAAELNALARVFAVMGMEPVGYYDLSVAGVPVHSTAFRPIDPAALLANPFRLFTSLLRLELIADEALRGQATALLDGRQILSDEALTLTRQAERDGGLARTDADRFVTTVLDTFRWHADARVGIAAYTALQAAHRLVADVVCFRGPHINHLTPRTLDIDAAQQRMQQCGMDAKAVIEGPPPRAVPILLRQTSFRALDEAIRFRDGAGTHTARFGEIEQRGVALTPKGRALYDACLNDARGTAGSAGGDYAARLAAAFVRFPDDAATLRRDGLAYFRYAITGTGGSESGDDSDLEGWIATGRVRAEPIIYEDFLPVSAAGIFQSNLGGSEQAAYAAHASQQAFEAALGRPVHEPFALYATQERESLAAVKAALDRNATATSPS